MTSEGQRILVTGAGKGIGRQTVIRLSARGATVVALSRDPADLRSLAAETGCEILACDVSDANAARTAAECALPVTGLVNCAGLVLLEPFIDTAVETFDRTIAVNTRAPMVISQVVVRDWLARGTTGAIVNVSSIAADVGFPNHAAYCASKAALDALTRVMAVELGGHGIRVNAVNPTVTLTPMGRMVWAEAAKAAPMLARIPAGRFLESDEVASVIMFLLSDDAKMVNGTCIDVDGGFRAG